VPLVLVEDPNCYLKRKRVVQYTESLNVLSSDLEPLHPGLYFIKDAVVVVFCLTHLNAIYKEVNRAECEKDGE